MSNPLEPTSAATDPSNAPAVQEGEENSTDSKRRRWPGLTAPQVTRLATLLIAVATIANVGVAWFQWKAMKAANAQNAKNASDAAKDTQAALKASNDQLEALRRQVSAFEVSNRAQLTVYRLDMDFADRSGGSVRMWLVNAGRIPAARVTVYAHVGWYPVRQGPGPVDPPKDVIFDIGNTEIPPGADPFSIRLPLQFSEDRLRNVRSGLEGVLLSGLIKYDDGFGKSASIDLCFWHQSEHGWARCTPRLNYTDSQDLERQVKEQQQKSKDGSRSKR